MPSAVSPNPRAGSQPPPDDLDNLLDYDNAVEDFLRDLPVGNDNQNSNAGAAEPPRDEDQEVQVKKKRNPVPKLDENRLLSDAGIPKLRKITKSRLKFRGKGHEFADISRLLNTYQLWLDDLYPRAKFRDALTMVEKVGHSKRMQVMRRAWLDDTKPYRKELTPEAETAGANAVADESRAGSGSSPSGEAASAGPVHGDQAMEGVGDGPNDDELDALLAESGVIDTDKAEEQRATTKRKGPFEEDDEDELDALMAENSGPAASEPVTKKSQKPLSGIEPDDDELDALMAEQTEPNVMSRAPTGNTSGNRSSPQDRMDDFADDEEALASMEGMW